MRLQIIFADRCTRADGAFWHVEHFVCSQCSVPLAGRRYVLPSSTSSSGPAGRGTPACVACYNALLADYCDSCGGVVSASERHVTVDGVTWHARDACFRCRRCRRSLLDRPLVKSASGSPGTLYCSTECRGDRKHATSHVTDDVTAGRGRRPGARRRRRSFVDKNRRKSLGDLDARLQSKASRLTVTTEDRRLSLSVFRLRETSI